MCQVSVKVHIERFVEDLFNHILALLQIERILFRCQGIQNDAQTPDVSTEAVGLTAVHLRWNVA